MPDNHIKAALYRIIEKRPDGRCIWATLVPARAGGEPVRALFCNADDVAFLQDETARHRMATLRDKNGVAARLLPVTVGLDVSIEETSAAGSTAIFALPRPSPLLLPAEFAGLRDVVAAAVRGHQSVAFALSDSKTIIDAAPIDRQTALLMLGMKPKR